VSGPRPPSPLLRRFGRTGLAFPEIGLGTWTFSGRDFGPIDEEVCVAVIREAEAAGVRFFDTADVYGKGRGERLLARGLSPGGGFVSTKVGNDFRGPRPRSRKNFDPAYLEEAVEACVRRLGRPRLDLVHLHNPPPEVLRQGGAVEALARMKRDGKVRLLGLSTVRPEEVRAVTEADVFDGVQLPFNLLRQELFLGCQDQLQRWGGAVVVRTPLEFGLLGGALPPAPSLAAEDYRRRAWEPGEEAAKRGVLPELRRLLEIDGRRSLAQAALRFALVPGCVAVVIPGARDIAQLHANVAASREVLPLDGETLRRVHRVLSEAGLTSGIVPELVPPARVSAGVDRRGGSPAAGGAGVRALFRPLRLGPVTVPNRIWRSGATERAVDESGLPTAAMASIHGQLARGGAGLVITGFLAVEPAGRASTSHPVLADSRAAAAWKKILSGCRREAPQAVFCAQLAHGGSRALAGYDERGVSERFVRAAELAAEAGFDAVQLHAAHGYLLNQLLAAPPPLRRGGEGHEGLRQVLDLVGAVRRAVGGDLAILAKVNMSDFSGSDYGAADAAVVVARLAEEGIDAVEWSAWTPDARAFEAPTRAGEVEPRSEGFFVPFASAMKGRHPRLVMGTCGGFRSSSGMVRALAHHGLDFVSLARPLIAEPDLPRRLRAGGVERAFCDGCNECLPRQVRPLHCPRRGPAQAA